VDQRPVGDIDGARRASTGLLADVETIDDGTARRASSLPGWTVGHVVTHLARNADSHVRLLVAAEHGQVADQYDSPEARAADIDAGAGRSAAELVDDLRAAIGRLDAAWRSTTATGWAGRGATRSGEVACAELPFLRWREVEVHRADLGLGWSWRDWSTDYVRLELRRMEMVWASRRPMGMATLPAAALALAPAHRLAWLLGRAEVDDLPVAGVFG
jgi:maleylpyruvate isomerase